MRIFADVLAVLTDDLFQLRREQMAFSLVEYVNHELHEALRWDAWDMASPAGNAGVQDHDRLILYEVLERGRQSIICHAQRITGGLDRLAKGKLPDQPVIFLSESFNLVDAVKRQVALHECLDPGAQAPTVGQAHGQ